MKRIIFPIIAIAVLALGCWMCYGEKTNPAEEAQENCTFELIKTCEEAVKEEFPEYEERYVVCQHEQDTEWGLTFYNRIPSGTCSCKIYETSIYHEGRPKKEGISLVEKDGCEHLIACGSGQCGAFWLPNQYESLKEAGCKFTEPINLLEEITFLTKEGFYEEVCQYLSIMVF